MSLLGASASLIREEGEGRPPHAPRRGEQGTSPQQGWPVGGVTCNHRQRQPHCHMALSWHSLPGLSCPPPPRLPPCLGKGWASLAFERVQDAGVGGGGSGSGGWGLSRPVHSLSQFSNLARALRGREEARQGGTGYHPLCASVSSPGWAPGKAAPGLWCGDQGAAGCPQDGGLPPGPPGTRTHGHPSVPGRPISPLRKDLAVTRFRGCPLGSARALALAARVQVGCLPERQ